MKNFSCILVLMLLLVSWGDKITSQTDESIRGDYKIISYDWFGEYNIAPEGNKIYCTVTADTIKAEGFTHKIDKIIKKSYLMYTVAIISLKNNNGIWEIKQPRFSKDEITVKIGDKSKDNDKDLFVMKATIINKN